MSLPNINEHTIRQNASVSSYERGRDYYRSGAVSGLVQRGETLEAEVEGSGYAPYTVRITSGDEGIEADCTCPYDYGGWCKHIVAVLLAYIHEKETVETRPGIEGQLADLNRDQLQNLLLTLVERRPGLADDIEMQISLMQSAASSSEAKAAPPPKVNAKNVRRQVRSALHALDRMSGSEAYWHVGGVVSGIKGIAQQAQAYIEAGDGRNAIALLEAVTDEYVREWTILDDSDGEVGALFSDLGALWTEAILSADLSEAERKTWAETLEAWQDEVGDYGIDEGFEAATYAAKQGWDYAPLQRVLSGKITSKGAWSGKPPWCADELAVARLRVLERQGRHQEYLYLAEAEGQMGLYVNMLARQGHVQEAIEKGLEYLGTAKEVLMVARTLHETGHTDEALRLGEHGLSMKPQRVSVDGDFFDEYPERKYDLALWLCGTAAERGNRELALRAAETAFNEDPDLNIYQKIQALADDRWGALRDDLLKRLRSFKGYDQEGPVNIFLHEGLVDDAIELADRSHHYELIRRVMSEVVEQRPEWVVQAARKQAEEIMDEGRANAYHHAVEWLERVRDAYRVMDQEKDWQAYLADIRATHHRKYKLMGLLKALD